MNHKRKTYLARSIENADEKAQYDAYAKKIISDRTILSWIAKYAVTELKDYSIPVIRSCIEGEPEVAAVPVYPGETKAGKAKDSSFKQRNEKEVDMYSGSNITCIFTCWMWRDKCRCDFTK